MKLGYLFPGQGSQSVGMLADFQELGSEVEDYLARASETIGVDLKSIVSRGPDELLNQTAITQPAILASSIGVFSMTRRFGMELPSAVAGHSLGEYSALVASGVLDFEDAVKLVHERGKIMQSAVPENTGAMVAVVGLTDEQVQQVCESVEGTVEIANYNSPGQVVIAGKASSVRSASSMCADLGARRVVPLAMSVPSHCSLLGNAGRLFEQVLKTVAFKPPNIKIYQNVNAKIANDPSDCKRNLVVQLSSSVLWHQSICAMIEDGITTFVECGPSKVLTGLMRRIDRNIEAIALSDRKKFEQLLRENR